MANIITAEQQLNISKGAVPPASAPIPPATHGTPAGGSSGTPTANSIYNTTVPDANANEVAGYAGYKAPTAPADIATYKTNSLASIQSQINLENQTYANSLAEMQKQNAAKVAGNYSANARSGELGTPSGDAAIDRTNQAETVAENNLNANRMANINALTNSALNSATTDYNNAQNHYDSLNSQYNSAMISKGAVMDKATQAKIDSLTSSLLASKQDLSKTTDAEWQQLATANKVDAATLKAGALTESKKKAQADFNNFLDIASKAGLSFSSPNLAPVLAEYESKLGMDQGTIAAIKLAMPSFDFKNALHGSVSAANSPDGTGYEWYTDSNTGKTIQVKTGEVQNPQDVALKNIEIQTKAQALSDAKSVSDLSGLISPVAQLPDGTYDTATQDAMLSKLSPSDAALVKAVGTYTMDIAKVTSLRSDQRQILAAKVALVYPGFDMTNYATHAAYRKSLAGTAQGTTGGAINSANKVINHLTSYIDNVSKLGNLPVGGFVGDWLNAGKSNVVQVFGQGTQAARAEAKTDATGVMDELAKFFKGTGVADVQTIKDWSKTVDINGSPAAQKGAVQGAIELLQGQLVPMIDQYKQVMGQEPPDGLFLKTETINKLSTLKNQGFKIDIPGVNYTDINAWVKYGGGSHDQWNIAVDGLKKAGLPLTDENILQAAQIIQ